MMTKNFSLKAGVLLAAWAVSGLAMAAETTAPAAPKTDPYPPVAFDMPDKPDFVKSLNLTEGRHGLPAGSEARKKALAPVYNEKLEQHSMTLHAQKGVTCVTCHDPKSIKTPDWMLSVSAPKMRKTCGDCHTVQAAVHAKTDTHAKIQCTACHMPNMPSLKDFKGDEKGMNYEAVRRAHLYKINIDPKVMSYVRLQNAEATQGKDGWQWAVDKDGYAYVDVMMSCSRATPADHTLSGDGRGCHSPATSTLDEGLRYADADAVAAEIAKWQKPVKNTWQKIGLGLERIPRLLEVTKLTPEEQTEVRLMLDKAQEIYDQVKTDGSWGVHAPRYLLDRVTTGEGYITKAQSIIDAAGYQTKKAATK